MPVMQDLALAWLYKKNKKQNKDTYSGHTNTLLSDLN